jgi:DNA-binding transcriptional MocR family regulator
VLTRADVPLIEDDIYGDLQHDGGRPVAAKAFDRHGNVLLCSSFSKTLSPGLRVGWVVAGRHHARVTQLKFVNTIATATLPQAAIADFLARGGYDRHLRRLRAALCARISAYSEAVRRYFPPGTRLSTPTGGFVLWVRLPGGVDALRLYQRAQDRGINITPGPAFSCGLGKFRDCIRLSCGAPLDAAMEAALKTLGRETALLAKGAS